jgi:hypothetical protein
MTYWDESKNSQLRKRHGQGFDDLLTSGQLIAIETNDRYPDQVRLLLSMTNIAGLLFMSQRDSAM